MPQGIIKSLVAVAVALSLSGYCYATNLLDSFVTFELEVDGGGTFQVYAQVSTDDTNKGLAGYSLPLGGSILTAGTSNVSPAGLVQAISLGPGEFKDIGFTEFRALLTNTDGTISLTATQTFDRSTPFIVFGFGQEAGDLADQIPPTDVLLTPQDGSYAARLLLVEGEWDNVNGTQPQWNRNNLTNLAANLYSGIATASDPQNFRVTEIVFDEVDENRVTLFGTDPNPIPEPASITLLALGGLLMSRRRVS